MITRNALTIVAYTWCDNVPIHFLAFKIFIIQSSDQLGRILRAIRRIGESVVTKILALLCRPILQQSSSYCRNVYNGVSVEDNDGTCVE